MTEPGEAPRGRRVVVLGNPNVGKTSLWSRLSREHAPVGNYPGITVERREGPLVGLSHVRLADVPGTYSLSARSADEQIAIDAALGLHGEARPDLAVVVLDSGQLARNLYLTVQLLELGVPSVLALNMIDEAGAARPDEAALGRELGVPVVATSARTGEGVDALVAAIAQALDTPPRPHLEVRYPRELRAPVDRLAELLPPELRGTVERDRGLARWLLTSVDEGEGLNGIPAELSAAALGLLAAPGGAELDSAIIRARWAHIDELVARVSPGAAPRAGQRASERIDAWLLHPVWGFAAFVAIMTGLFQGLFSGTEPLVGLIETTVLAAQRAASGALPQGALRDLVVDGVLGGVGNVLVFVPQIVFLFLLIGVLEDSGYMARVAYLMDRVMRGLGLHGRAFVPMLSGFACAIPAILATRTMERRRDRLLTMLVIPLMTCSARLPVYALVIGATMPERFLGGRAPLHGPLLAGMYILASLVALAAAAVLGRTVVRGRRVPLILELPPYRRPELASTLRGTWERTASFLRGAGTTILGATIVLWALLSFPRFEAPVDLPEAERGRAALEQSYGGRLGRAIEPLIEPLGFDWKIGVGLIGAFAAREVFVSTLGLVEGLGSVDDEAIPLRERLRAESLEDGTPRYTAPVGAALLVFFAVACQCVSTLAVVRRETGTVGWPAFLFAYTLVLAWVLAFAVHGVGVWLGAA